MKSIADSFVASNEFQSRYGELGNGEFVALIYQNVLGRAPDADGLSYWVDRLDTGMDVSDLILGFANSSENISNSLPNMRSWFVENSSYNDVFYMTGSTGTMVAGGLGRDTFVFEDTMQTECTITDFEASDLISFSGFSNIAEGQIGNYMTQLYGGVKFEISDTTIYFENLEIADLSSWIDYI